MHIDIISVVPGLLEGPFSHSILKRAEEKGLATIRVHNLRDYATGKQKQVDDYAFGGGAGMVMMIEPIANCIEAEFEGVECRTTHAHGVEVRCRRVDKGMVQGILNDAEALYIGAILYDDPDGIIALQKRRDGYLSTDDRFMWILDTFHDGRTGYFFEVNAAGMMGDALLTHTASSGNSSSRSRT